MTSNRRPWSRGRAGQGRGGRPWRRKRDQILRRDQGLCQPCKRKGRYIAAVQVDHVIELAQGGTDDDSNLESICKDCHDDKTLGRSSTRGCDMNGNPL